MNKMRYPSGPFLELSFYLPKCPESEIFYQFLLKLLNKGAELSGNGYIHRGVDIQEQPFSSIHDHPLEEVMIESITYLDNYFNDPDTRLVQVQLDHAIGLRRGVSEIATIVQISEEASMKDHHPVVLWADGGTFAGPAESVKGGENQRSYEGKLIYEYFSEMVKILKPAYAAITVEEPLECPTDLKKDPRSMAFEDFYINGEYIGEENLKLIRNEFSEAYIKPIADGLFISTYKYMNPEGIGLDHLLASKKSMFVARLIGELKGKG